MAKTFLHFRCWLVVGTLFLAIGGHWALLQTVAWASMIVDYSRTAALTVAVEKMSGWAASVRDLQRDPKGTAVGEEAGYESTGEEDRVIRSADRGVCLSADESVAGGVFRNVWKGADGSAVGAASPGGLSLL